MRKNKQNRHIYIKECYLESAPFGEKSLSQLYKDQSEYKRDCQTNFELLPPGVSLFDSFNHTNTIRIKFGMRMAFRQNLVIGSCRCSFFGGRTHSNISLNAHIPYSENLTNDHLKDKRRCQILEVFASFYKIVPFNIVISYFQNQLSVSCTQ